MVKFPGLRATWHSQPPQGGLQDPPPIQEYPWHMNTGFLSNFEIIYKTIGVSIPLSPRLCSYCTAHSESSL